MNDSRPPAEPLDLDEAFNASPEVAAELERNRPGPITLVEFGVFMKQFHWTEEQLKSIPLTIGEPFTLD